MSEKLYEKRANRMYFVVTCGMQKLSKMIKLTKQQYDRKSKLIKYIFKYHSLKNKFHKSYFKTSIYAR